MKKQPPLWTLAGILAAGLMAAGCAVVPARTVVVREVGPGPDTTVVVHRPGHVVGVLPPGYVVRRHRGAVFYECHGVCYRPHRRGFVVVHRPW